MGEEKRTGDVGGGPSVGRRPKDVLFALGQRVAGSGQGLGREVRVDDALTRHHLAHGRRERVGRRVLDHEAAGAGLHRAAQVAGPPEGRDHEDFDVRVLLADAGRRGDPVHDGHLDVGQDDVDVAACNRLDRLASIAGLRDDLDVLFEIEHHGDGAANQSLVVRHDYPYRHASSLLGSDRLFPGRMRGKLSGVNALRRQGSPASNLASTAHPRLSRP